MENFMIKSFEEMEVQAVSRPSKRIALAMAEETDALTAITHAAGKKIVQPILIGSETEIRKTAEKAELDISGFPIIQADGSADSAGKAVRLVREGEADLLMKGKVQTAIIMKAALNRETGIRGSGVLSHVTIIETPFYHKLLFMSDPALNIAPDLHTKVEILKNAVQAAHLLGIDVPKVAVIGALEKVNTAMPVTVDAAILSKMGDRDQLGRCMVDGPFALDNAISKKSCEVKGIRTEVGGDADILLMPDIEAANVFYKTFAYLSDTNMCGIIMGALSPIILTSRADSNSTKYFSILTGVTLA